VAASANPAPPISSDTVTAAAAGLSGRRAQGSPRRLPARADWVLWLLLCCMAGPPVPPAAQHPGAVILSAEEESQELTANETQHYIDEIRARMEQSYGLDQGLDL
jgi:hypothetical protein